jgi:hypothetical protein
MRKGALEIKLHSKTDKTKKKGHKMERLRYEYYKGCENILKMDIGNGYSVIAFKVWNRDEHRYFVEMYLKEDTISDLKLIEEAENLEFRANYKTIDSAILATTAKFIKEDFFDYYIGRYEYELRCSEIGNEILEPYCFTKES